MVFVIWWASVLWFARRFLAKRFESGSVLKQIEDDKIRIGLIVLMILPFLYVVTKGLVGDIKEANVRGTQWKEVISIDMYEEATPENFEVADFTVEKNGQGYYIVTLNGAVGDVKQSVVFYQEPNKGKEYGSMKCDPKWAFDVKYESGYLSGLKAEYDK